MHAANYGGFHASFYWCELCYVPRVVGPEAGQRAHHMTVARTTFSFNQQSANVCLDPVQFRSSPSIQFLFMAILFFFILLCFVWYSYAFGVHIELCTKTSHLQFVVVWWLAFCALLHIHLWCSSRSLLPRVAARRHRRRRRRYCCCCIDDVLLFRTDEFVFKFLSRRMNAVILRYALCASQQFRMLVHGAVFCPHSSQMAYCVTNVAMIAFALLFFFYSSCRSIFLDDAMRSI